MTERENLTALTAGADLWLIPSLEQSAWSKRIDWYLGFQIRRALPHRRFEFGPDMRQLMESFEQPIPRIGRVEDAPLMVGSSNLLPNKQTVMIPANADFAASCHRVWEGLGRPSTRVFLPEGVTSAVFQKKWPLSDTSLELVST